MTTNIVLLGGSGYIGRQLVQAWRQRNTDTEFWILSRSGDSGLALAGVHGLAVDLTQSQLGNVTLPAQVDYLSLIHI